MNQVQLEQVYTDILNDIREERYYTAIEEAAGMVAVAKLHQEPKYIFLGKYLMGVTYYNLYEFHQSMDKYMELTNMVLDSDVDLDALELKEGFMDQVRYGMALDMYHLGDLDGGAIVLSHILEQCTDEKVILDSILMLGVIYLMMYELNNDLSYLIITLEMYLSLLEVTSLHRTKRAMVHNNLAILFRYQGEHQKAQEMLNNSFILTTSPIELVSIFNEMARIHIDVNNLEKARKNLEKADEYLSQCNSPLEEGQNLLLWGLLMKEEEKFIEAQRLMEKSLFLAKKCNSQIEQIRVCRELGILYERMGHGPDSEYFFDYNELKDNINPAKEVIEWQKVWLAIKDRVSLVQSLIN